MSFAKLFELEKSLAQEMSSMKGNLLEQVRNIRLMDGVEVLSEVPAAISVPLSLVQQTNVLDPDFYSPHRQAEAVAQKIAASRSSLSLITDLRQMIRRRRVTYKGACVMLNDETVQVLREALKELDTGAA